MFDKREFWLGAAIGLLVAVVALSGLNIFRRDEAADEYGSIVGTVTYPASVLPGQTVCAEPTKAGERSCQYLMPGESAFHLRVKPGNYRVYAQLNESFGDFDTDYRAYFNEYSRCLFDQCSDDLHDKLIEVEIENEESVVAAYPHDWYAPIP